MWQPCPWFSGVSCVGNGSNGPSKTKNHKNTPIFWKFVPLTHSKKIHNDVTDTFCAELFKRARFSLHSLLKTITTIVGRSPNRLFPHISQLHQTIIHTQRIHQRRAALIHFWQCLKCYGQKKIKLFPPLTLDYHSRALKMQIQVNCLLKFFLWSRRRHAAPQ